jgi:hypothetical protein
MTCSEAGDCYSWYAANKAKQFRWQPPWWYPQVIEMTPNVSGQTLSDSGPDKVGQADNAHYVVPGCPTPRPHGRDKLRGANLVGEGDHPWFAFGLEYVDWHTRNIALRAGWCHGGPVCGSI